MVGGIALAGGGYDVATRHVAGLAAWLLVVALLVLGAGARAIVGRPLYLGAGLIGAVAVISAISSLWSGSAELSTLEADRVLVYLGFFLAAFLIAQTAERRQGFAEGLAISLALVAVLGLASRLLPHVFEVSQSLGSGPRLRYPLGYWNANGMALGAGAALLAWMSRHSRWRSLRWASAGALPAVFLALYFTYSRGGLLALAVATIVLLALSRDRLWLLGSLAAGALGALPAILATQSRSGVADNLDEAATIGQGVTVLLVLLAGVALALALYGLLRRVERRGGGLTERALGASRDPRLLKGIAATAALVALIAALAVGGRAWDRFSSSDIQFPDNPASHYSDLSGAGRHDFWRVAIDSFGEKPLLGSGAGTYEFSWERHRSIELPLHNAHSLYLQAFAELGAVGGLLLLGMVGFLLWCAYAVWRAAPPDQRDTYAALLGTMLAFAVGAAIDWFWQLAAVGAVFFVAAGVVVAARCAQTSPGEVGERAEGRRYGLGVVGVVVAWIAAVALAGPLLVDRELDASRASAADGNLPEAVDQADRARSIEPWAASPYVQLGLLAQLRGEYPLAIEHFTHAIQREDHNWQWYYLRSEVEHEAGDDAAANRDLERAREFNPLQKCLQEDGWTC